MRLTYPHPHRPFQLAATLAFAALTLSVGRAADADKDQTVRLEEFEVRERQSSALVQAPTDSVLEARQPVSVIGLQYISHNVAPTADLATIANSAPSVSNVETNGPGLSESKHLTMCGFVAAEYNVTFDGIPFGDQNDYFLTLSAEF